MVEVPLEPLPTLPLLAVPEVPEVLAPPPLSVPVPVAGLVPEVADEPLGAVEPVPVEVLLPPVDVLVVPVGSREVTGPGTDPPVPVDPAVPVVARSSGAVVPLDGAVVPCEGLPAVPCGLDDEVAGTTTTDPGTIVTVGRGRTNR